MLFESPVLRGPRLLLRLGMPAMLLLVPARQRGWLQPLLAAG